VQALRPTAAIMEGASRSLASSRSSCISSGGGHASGSTSSATNRTSQRASSRPVFGRRVRPRTPAPAPGRQVPPRARAPKAPRATQRQPHVATIKTAKTTTPSGIAHPASASRIAPQPPLFELTRARVKKRPDDGEARRAGSRATGAGDGDRPAGRPVRHARCDLRARDDRDRSRGDLHALTTKRPYAEQSRQ
jgi:hypothetical protein